VEEVKLLRERCLKLEELSFVDGLTGLYNFRYMQIALEMEMERTRRTKLPTGLIMLDVDHFKDFNARYGHEGGNAALAALGKLLKESVRVIDIPCRYGGEEFAVILPNAFHKQTVSIAERLRELVQACSVEFKGQTLHISASFGVTVFNRSDQETLSSFISKADLLLYDAKEAGRNRVCSDESCFTPLIEEATAEEKSALFSSDEN
jgi:diguanylate cyclase (GGDEF)-like protein